MEALIISGEHKSKFMGVTFLCCDRKNHDECLPTEKTFRVPNIDNVIQEGKKAPKKYCDITLHKIGSPLRTDLYTASGWPSVSGDALKAIAGKVSAEYDFSNDDSEPPLVDDSHYSDKKDIDISAYGTAYAAFGGGQEGMEACHAIAALCDVCTIDSLISNFILPLQVHMHLNPLANGKYLKNENVKRKPSSYVIC